MSCRSLCRLSSGCVVALGAARSGATRIGLRSSHSLTGRIAVKVYDNKDRSFTKKRSLCTTPADTSSPPGADAASPPGADYQAPHPDVTPLPPYLHSLPTVTIPVTRREIFWSVVGYEFQSARKIEQMFPGVHISGNGSSVLRVSGCEAEAQAACVAYLTDLVDKIVLLPTVTIPVTGKELFWSIVGYKFQSARKIEQMFPGVHISGNGSSLLRVSGCEAGAQAECVAHLTDLVDKMLHEIVPIDDTEPFKQSDLNREMRANKQLVHDIDFEGRCVNMRGDRATVQHYTQLLQDKHYLTEQGFVMLHLDEVKYRLLLNTAPSIFTKLRSEHLAQDLRVEYNDAHCSVRITGRRDGIFDIKRRIGDILTEEMALESRVYRMMLLRQHTQLFLQQHPNVDVYIDGDAVRYYGYDPDDMSRFRDALVRKLNTYKENTFVISDKHSDLLFYRLRHQFPNVANNTIWLDTNKLLVCLDGPPANMLPAKDLLLYDTLFIRYMLDRGHNVLFGRPGSTILARLLEMFAPSQVHIDLPRNGSTYCLYLHGTISNIIQVEEELDALLTVTQIPLPDARHSAWLLRDRGDIAKLFPNVLYTIIGGSIMQVYYCFQQDLTQFTEYLTSQFEERSVAFPKNTSSKNSTRNIKRKNHTGNTSSRETHGSLYT